MKVGLLYVALMLGIVLVVFVEPARVIMGAVLGVLFFGGCALATWQGIRAQRRSAAFRARGGAGTPGAPSAPRHFP